MPRELLADYPLSAARYDEMLEAPLTPRAHWRPMFEQLAAASAAQMKERIQAVQRQVRENGVSYNVYADPEGADRPWELDVLPLIIPPDEWRGIAAAVAQRHNYNINYLYHWLCIMYLNAGHSSPVVYERWCLQAGHYLSG